MAGEERPDTRLSEQDTAGGSQEGSKDRNKEGTVTEQTDGDGQREGQEAEQQDRTVTAPMGPGRDTHSNLGIDIWRKMSSLVLRAGVVRPEGFPAEARST